MHVLTHNADVKLEPKHLASIKKLKQQHKAQDQIEIFGVSPKNLTSIKKPDDGVIQRDVGKIRKVFSWKWVRISWWRCYISGKFSGDNMFLSCRINLRSNDSLFLWLKLLFKATTNLVAVFFWRVIHIGIWSCYGPAELLSLDGLSTISFEDGFGFDVVNKLWLTFIFLMFTCLSLHPEAIRFSLFMLKQINILSFTVCFMVWVVHPIHDQIFYLTSEDKAKLKQEYGMWLKCAETLFTLRTYSLSVNSMQFFPFKKKFSNIGIWVS